MADRPKPAHRSRPGVEACKPCSPFEPLTDAELSALIAHAARVRDCAYAPYSGYRVGAAVVADDDCVFFGCNVENASYGLSLCAERSALAAALAAGACRVRAVVVVTDADPPGTPCGACRQWLAELGGEATEVVAATPAGLVRRFRLGDLLPDAFRLGSARIHPQIDAGRRRWITRSVPRGPRI